MEGKNKAATSACFFFNLEAKCQKRWTPHIAATLWDKLNIKNDYLNEIPAAAFLANSFILKKLLKQNTFLGV